MNHVEGQQQPQLRLMQRLEDLGMSYADLARIVGVTPASVSYWCRGVRRPSADQATRVARSLAAPTDAVWTYVVPAMCRMDEAGGESNDR